MRLNLGDLQAGQRGHAVPSSGSGRFQRALDSEDRGPAQILEPSRRGTAREKHMDGWRRGSCYSPSCWYSSIVFFSPTLKPSVCSGVSSSSWCSALDMMAECRQGGCWLDEGE